MHMNKYWNPCLHPEYDGTKRAWLLRFMVISFSIMSDSSSLSECLPHSLPAHAEIITFDLILITSISLQLPLQFVPVSCISLTYNCLDITHSTDTELYVDSNCQQRKGGTHHLMPRTKHTKCLSTHNVFFPQYPDTQQVVHDIVFLTLNDGGQVKSAIKAVLL